ncbi:hypothetical protein D8674_020035, partial [Pyrus ussuriensis x Pyrus communis]
LNNPFSNVSKKKNASRPNTKRGCTCHFIVKQLIAEPSVALIIYNHDKHMAAGTRAMFASCISEDLLLCVQSLLYAGVSVETIMQRHNESVEKQGGPSNRDDLLTIGIISMWVENHQSHVFFYEDFSDVDPFTLGIQTEWQLQQMIRFGNRSLIAFDSRFGTTKLKYSVHSLLVFNEDKKAIPVAWIVASKFGTMPIKWMKAPYNRVQTKDHFWKLAGFIVDDPLADVLTIRLCSVLISFWRVRYAWHKNLVKKCVDNEMRATMSRRLHQAVDHICHQRGAERLFEDFIEDFLDESDFMNYFKATWYPRIGMWISALQNLPLASQETSAAMEFYHSQLKLRLLNEKKPTVYKRVDWLVDKLVTKVHSYFWPDEYSEKDDFARYWKDEWASGLTSWCKALKIPDCNIVMGGTRAKVIDELDQDNTYVVWNPGLQFGICNCRWAEMGNLCEHILIVINICQKRLSTPFISLLQYHKALIDMLHCPPHDSLIRDHAFSSVFVQKQLSGLVNLESNNTTMDVASFANRDQELVNQDPINEEVLSLHKNNCGDEDVAAERTKGEVTTELSNLVVRGNDVCNESSGEEITGDEMDIDPSSMCISPPGLHSVDEDVCSCVYFENRQRSLFNREIEDLCPDDFLNRNSQENTMDEDMNIPSSTMEFVEQCTVTHPNDYHSHDIEPTVICKTSDDNTVYTKVAPSASMPVESQVVEVAETPGNHPSSADDAASIDGPRDDLVNASDCSRDLKAVGSMMVVLLRNNVFINL